MKKAVILLLVLCFFITGCSVKKIETLTDQEKFAKEYNISKDNPFEYTTIDKIIDIFKNGTAIVLFANSDEESSTKAVKILYQTIKEESVEKIYYYNPKTLQEKQPKQYQSLITEINFDITNYQLKLPTLYAIKDGIIINYSDYFSKKEHLSDEYLTTKRIKQIKQKYKEVLNYEKSSDTLFSCYFFKFII